MILIVDDDPSVTASLGLLLKQAGHVSVAASRADEAMRLLHAGGVELVVQDMNFSRETTGEEGLALLRRLKGARPETPVVLMTAWGSIALAVEGMKLGAADFVTKPWTNAHLLQSVQTALALSGPSAAPAPISTRAQVDARFPAPAIIGGEPRLLRVLEQAARAAPTDAGVLITGESGTGKELLAEALHRGSRRRDAPFVKVNLGGISSTLFESEMFGHVRGAFTDARASRRGRFEAADGGTIFLDEIGELEPASQVKLLRVLQDRTYEPLGSSETRSVDVRVVAATNRDLAELVKAGQFREDLLYRLNLIHLRLPPLRERAGDIALIAGSVLADLASRHGRPEVRLTARAIAWMQTQPWPGNVRQLRQALERAVVLLGSDELDAPALAALAEAEAGAPAGEVSAEAPTIDAMERVLIERSLRQHDGNITRAAAALGISRPALYRRMETPRAGPEPGVTRPARFGLRARLVAYVGLLHVALAVLAVHAFADQPWSLLACEGGLVVSVLLGVALVKALFVPLELLTTGADLLREGDTTSRFVQTGQPELDALADVYNRMADRLRGERVRLVEQDLFLERLVDASPAGVITLDLDGQVSLISPSAERLLGLTNAECVGRPLAEAGTPEAAALSGLPTGGSRLLSRGDRTLRARRAEFHDRGFARTFYLVEELTDELRASERAAHERIVQVMAHEVRNTVGAVHSLLDSVARLGAPPDAASRGDFEAALSIAAQRLLGLNAFMNAVADVVRLPAPEKRPCDVGALVADIVTLMGPDAESRGLQVRFRREAEQTLPLDKNQVEQALINVLRNAFEATPRSGTIDVALASENGTPLLRIRDGGPGIAPAVQGRLFSPFFTTKPGGRGVGLMLVHEVLSRHGLPFSLRSHPDGGAEFEVRFGAA